MNQPDDILDLTQDDNDNCTNVLSPVRTRVTRSSDTGLSPLSPKQTRSAPGSSNGVGKGKGKGKGKRSSVDPPEVNAQKQARKDELNAKKQASEAAKQQVAAEKEAKKAAIEMNKIYKPGECMKYMNIEMHPSLASEWYMENVSREAAALGARVVPTSDLCDRNVVMWSRSVQPRLAGEGGKLGLSARRESCARALYVWPALAAQERVAERSLAAHVARARDLLQGDLTLVLFGLREFFRSSKRKTANSNRKLMTEIELEMALTDLLVYPGCDTVMVNSSSELALFIVQCTKAIAEAPYKMSKRACDERAEFYMKGDNKNCISVDKAGNGLARLWQQMVAVLPHSSLEVARAVCGQYKSPLEMYEALSDGDGVGSLAALGVARAAAPARARRLGPEAARRLRAALTEERGDVLLD